MKKNFLIIALIISLVICPGMAYAETTQPLQNRGDASMGTYSQQGAVVGKVIGQVDGTDRYIVYGRLSVLTPEGYRVYKTGKFFYIYGTTQQHREFIASQTGKGIKAFGKLELVSGKNNAELILTDSVIKYEPKNDVGTMEPAYGEKTGPFNWIGFSIAQGQYEISDVTIKKSTDIVNMLAHFTDLVLIEGRTLRTESTTGTVAYEPATKTEYKIEEVVQALTGVKNKFTPDKKDYLYPIRQFWQANIKHVWLMERNEAVCLQMSQAIKGYTFLNGQSGQTNNLLEEVCATRPDMDKYMTYVENQKEEKFSDWATQAVFYGKIDGKLNKEVFLCSTPRRSQNYNGTYVNPDYIGPYYPEDDPQTLVDAIADIKNDKIPVVKSDDPADSYQNKEKWQIGWQGENTMYPGLTPAQYAQYSGHYVWMSGTRVLVYKVTTCNQDGTSTVIEHVESGNMEEGTFSTGDTTVTVSLIGHYIKPDHIIVKSQYNYLLNLIREISFKGGI